jgi:hypothetical protein
MSIHHERHDAPNVNFQNITHTTHYVEKGKSLARHALDNLDDEAFKQVVSKALRDRPWMVANEVVQGFQK